MKGIYIIGILGLSILFFVSLLLILSMESEATTITVDGNGGADFKKIQEAINNANPGDTVYVHSGIYNENLVVNRTINLTGENMTTTIIDGGSSGDVIYVNASWVNITGFTATNSGSLSWDAGIELDNVQNCRIINNTISNNDDGIYLYLSENIIIEGNHVSSNNITGIYLRYSSNTYGRITDNDNIITGNIVNNNHWGIYLWKSSNNEISKNYVSDNVFGIEIYQSSTNIVINNTISSNNNDGITVGGIYNAIYHNNFINNGNQAYDSSSNHWDIGYPLGGNYWSDYDGVDNLQGSDQNVSGSDGIGDTPYVIDDDSRDNYPLMNPIKISIPTISEPDSPTELTVTTGDNYFLLSWLLPESDGGSPVTNYKIYRNTVSGGETFFTEIGNVLYYNDTSVTNDVTYYYKVSAKNAVGEGLLSNEVNATPKASSTTYVQPPATDNEPSWWLWVTLAIVTAIILIVIVTGYVRRKSKKPRTKKKLENKKDDKEWTECPKCNVRLKVKNLDSHMKKTHKK